MPGGGGGPTRRKDVSRIPAACLAMIGAQSAAAAELLRCRTIETAITVGVAILRAHCTAPGPVSEPGRRGGRHAADYAVLVIRQARRGSTRLLRLDFQALENRRNGAIQRRGPGSQGFGDDCELRARRSAVRRTQRPPQFTFSSATSFIVNCDSQAEIDEYWARLSDGGETHVCGWLKDRFGVSWQIVPRALGQMLDGADAQRTGRVMRAIMTMTKLDLAALERAWREP